MKNIITKETLSRVIELFDSKSKAIFLGKGPTFEVPDADSDALIVCANTTLNVCPRCDILVANDAETFAKLKKEKVEAVGTVLIPVHPHVNRRPDPKTTFGAFYKFFPDYKNPLIPYNLRTSKPNPKFCDLRSAFSSPITAYEFVLTHLKNVKHVDFYGISVFNKIGYHAFFKTEADELLANHGAYKCGNPACLRPSCNPHGKERIMNHNRYLCIQAARHGVSISIN